MFRYLMHSRLLRHGTSLSNVVSSCEEIRTNESSKQFTTLQCRTNFTLASKWTHAGSFYTSLSSLYVYKADWDAQFFGC